MRFSLHLAVRSWTIVLLLGVVVETLPAQEVLEQARQDVERLTSRELAGRGYVGDGHDRAAEYLRSRFEAIGVEPVGSSYFQRFPLDARLLVATPTLAIDGKPLAFGRDFLPGRFAASGSGEAMRIVDVGAGVFVPDRINDYKDRDVRGAMVLLRSQVPAELTADTSIARELLSPESRAYIAYRMGARAVMMSVERLSFAGSFGEGEVPIFEVREGSLPSAPSAASFRLRIENVDDTSRNVIGRLPGTSDSDSTILITAHYDHLGATDDSTWFPGANDNASGVAMMLALARHLRDNPARLPVVFIAFSGEEIGLVGSRHFTYQPTIRLEHVRFMLNVDMTASGTDGIMAVGGVEHPAEWSVLKRLADSIGCGDVRKRENAPNGDHYFLTKHGVPAFYVYPFTGYQPYHHIDDRIDTLQWNVFERMFKVYAGFVREL